MAVAGLSLRALEERVERLDARARVKVSPGQLGLDFSAPAASPPKPKPAAAAGKGPGSGEKCGSSWIDPKKTCRKKGQSRTAPDDRKPDTTFTSDEATALIVLANKKLRSDKARRAEMIRLGVKPDTDFVGLVAQAREKLGGPDWWKPESGWSEKLQGFAKAAQVPSNTTTSVLTNPDRYDPGLAPKAKQPGINAQDVTTSAQQALLARQQRKAAEQAGDQKAAEAWTQQERAAERDRLQNALNRSQQSQGSLFGVTEYDESMPLFRQRRDSVDPVAQLCGSILREQLPGAQVLDWSRHPRGITAGRAVSEGLVYRFRLDADSIGYRPAWEGIDEQQWELRSEGFLAARDPSARLDFKRGLKFRQKTTKRQCSKGYGCGSACISLNKECRVAPKSAISKVRLRQLQALAQEGDQKAATQAQELQMQREAKAQSLQKGRQVGRLEKMLQDPRVAEMLRTGKVPEAAAGAPKPGEVRNVKPDEIEVDPERFQYKIGSSATGEVGSLSGVQRWDPNLAGVVNVWQDPADGKTYVVNGHNRLALSKRLGAEEVTVRYLEAGSAQEARAIGAMQNIAEGAGSEIDAGKFFRDSGLKTLEEVKAKGLPLQSGKAEKGLALAQLPDEMFNDVVQGNLRMRRAAVIGASGLDHDKQREVYKVLKARPSMTDETLEEYVQHLAVSSRQTQEEINLFGTSEKSVDTGLARAELANGLKKALGREARLLGAVSKSAQAVELLEQKGGNTINVEQSQQQAGEASSVLRTFNQLKNLSGPVKTALDQAAARVTAGENRNKVARELREQVVQAMEEELKRLGLRKEAAPPVDDLTMNLFDSMNRIDALDDRLTALQTRMDLRCQRPDGTYYGTKGRCRKGKQAGAVATQKKATPKKAASKPPAGLTTSAAGKPANRPTSATNKTDKITSMPSKKEERKPVAKSEEESTAATLSRRGGFRVMAKAAGKALAQALAERLQGANNKAPQPPKNLSRMEEMERQQALNLIEKSLNPAKSLKDAGLDLESAHLSDLKKAVQDKESKNIEKAEKYKKENEALLKRNPAIIGGKPKLHEESNRNGWHRKTYRLSLGKPMQLPTEPGSNEYKPASDLFFQVQTNPVLSGMKLPDVLRSLKEQGVSISRAAVKSAKELHFSTAVGDPDELSPDRIELPKPLARKLALSISREIANIVASLPEGQLVVTKANYDDGYGEQRKALYERAGFTFVGETAVAVVKAGRLARISVDSKKQRKDSSDYIDLDNLLIGLAMNLFDSADRFDSLMARIDAARRKCQTGYACGSSCISADKDCRSEGRATTGKERLKRLEQAAQGGGAGHGIGRLKGGAAAAKAEEIRVSRSEQAAQLRQQRAQRRPAGGALVPTGGSGQAVTPEVVTPEVVKPGPSTGRPGSIASTMREALNAMKAADARQMGLVAEQLFETDWLLERRGRYRGMSKDQAREQYKAEFMQKLQEEANSPEAAARRAEMGRRAAESGSVSGAMRSLLEEMKASDDRLNDLTQQAIDLRVGAEEQFGGEGDDPGLGGSSNRRRLGRGRRRDAADDRFDALITRLSALGGAIR